MRQDRRFRLIVNGMIVAKSNDLAMLKVKGYKQKTLNTGHMVSIEDARGDIVHHFFGV